jgi:hypothetical protein
MTPEPPKVIPPIDLDSYYISGATSEVIRTKKMVAKKSNLIEILQNQIRKNLSK